MKEALIILPTYNEKDNIVTLLPAILEQAKKIENWHISILVVDDTSPDATFDEVLKLQKKYSDIYVIQGKKEGLGRAYVRGFSYALENLHPDVLFEMDADWSHDPENIPGFLRKIDQGADLVIGTRYIKGGGIPNNWGLHRKIFSYCGNLVVRFGFMHLKVHDWTNGYRAMRASFARDILHHLGKYNGYVFQIALLDQAVKKHLVIAEFPIQFKERKSGISKISAFKYIYDILAYILVHSSFVKFVIVGFVGFLINLSGLEYFYRHGSSPALAAAFGAEISILSNFLLNNFWSFSHKKILHKKHFLPKFLHFNAVSFGSIVIQFIVVGLGTHIFGDHTRILFLLISVICFIMPYSYFMYNRFIWKKK